MPSTSGLELINIFHLSNFKFDTKNAIPRKDPSLPASLERLRYEFELIGQRRTVEAVILVHENRHLHVLLLQISPTLFRLPGGELEPNENEIDGLQRHLNQFLAPNDDTPDIKWEVVDLIANWWRPNFEQNFYPYLPAHITKPKEHRKLFLIRLPEKVSNFSVPDNYKLVAVPFLEIYDNAKSYGHVISSLPQTLSRFNFNMI